MQLVIKTSNSWIRSSLTTSVAICMRKVQYDITLHTHKNAWSLFSYQTNVARVNFGWHLDANNKFWYYNTMVQILIYIGEHNFCDKVPCLNPYAVFLYTMTGVGHKIENNFLPTAYKALQKPGQEGVLNCPERLSEQNILFHHWFWNTVKPVFNDHFYN